MYHYWGLLQQQFNEVHGRIPELNWFLQLWQALIGHLGIIEIQKPYKLDKIEGNID